MAQRPKARRPRAGTSSARSSSARSPGTGLPRAAIDRRRSTRRGAGSDRESLLAEAERIAHVGSWVWDVHRNEVRWSDELFRILGYVPGRDQATVEAFYAALHPDDLEKVREQSSRAAATGDTSPAECRVVRRDGTIREVRLDGASIRDGDGRLLRLIGTVVDVTELKTAEAALRRTAHQLEEAEQIAGLGSWTWDPHRKIVEWSRSLYGILGLNPASTPSIELFVDLVHPEDRHLVEAHVDAALVAGPSSAQYRIVRSDGVVRHLQVERRPIHSPGGRLLSWTGTVLDVTERKLLEDQLRQAQKMDALGTLAGGVAHDFNNYLHVILGLGEVLSRQVGPGVHQRTVEQIRQAAERCSVLTRQLLAFGRRQRVEPQVLDLGQVVTSSGELLQHLVGEGIRLECEIGLGAHHVRADPAQFEQVLINLAANARDAMPGGGVLRIEVGRILADAAHVDLWPGMVAGPHVVLIVEDHGSGIPAEVLPHVFEPFFTTKEHGRGTGLGLATVYGIVKDCRGHIDVASEPDRGTMFRLYFPAVEAPAAVLHEPPGSSPVPGGQETVLVAEDDPDIRTLTCAHLREAGYTVLEAADGEAALVRARGRDDIALLVADVRMPNMGGYALARFLAAERPALRVIFMSGYAEKRLPGHAVLRDADFLAKPFTARELLLRVRQVLDAVLRRPSRVAT